MVLWRLRSHEITSNLQSPMLGQNGDLRRHDSSTTMTEIPAGKKYKTTVENLEAQVRLFAASINCRDFSLTSPSWSQMASGFVCSVGYLHEPQDVDINGLLTMLCSVTEANPEYFVKVVDTSTTIDESAGTAQVCVNEEITGIHDGVAQQSMSMIEWKRVDGKWRCTRHKSLQGLDGMGYADLNSQPRHSGH